MKKKILVVLLALAMVFCFVACGTDEGETVDYPTDTITLICPYGAGGGTDVILRALADQAGKIAGVNVVVEDITGGNGATGVVTMMESDPDGYTIGSCSGEWIALKEMGLTPEGFDYNNAEKIMHYNFDPACYLVLADSPIQTIEDLVNAAKEKPGEVTLGVTAAGGSHHLASILFSDMAGVKFNTVPYSEGSSATITALMSGQLDVASVCPSEAAAQIQAGQVRVLGICSAQRLDTYSDVPTMTECGYELVYGAWRALCAPKGTDAAKVEALEKIFLEAAETEEFKEFCAANGFVRDVLTKAEFEERFVSQEALIKQVCALYAEQQ